MTSNEILKLVIDEDYIKAAKAISEAKNVTPSVILRALEIARDNGKLEASQVLMVQARDARNRMQARLDLEADGLK